MAQNGATSVRVTQWDSLRFSWTRTAINVAENTSTINWTLELVSGSSGRIDSSVSKEWSVTIDGQTFKGSNTVGVANNATLKLASGTAKIKHDAGGAKSFSYSFSQEFEIIFSGSRIGVISGSGSGELDAIYQPSTMTLSTESLEMGSDVKITASNTNTSFTHNLAYKFADSGWLKIADGVKGDYTWTVPLKLAEMIPTKIEGTVVIRCLTYSGDKLIGQTTAFLTVRVPTSVVPVISEVTITEATEAMSGMDVFAQSLSALNVEIKASGAGGSTIKSYTSTFEKKTYTGETWTSDIIRGQGNIELRVTVTDSRGRKASAVERVSVLKYSQPIITNFQARRCDDKGALTEDGEYMRIDYTVAIYALNGGNEGTVKASRKTYSAVDYDNPFHNSTITKTETSSGTYEKKAALYFKSVIIDHDTTYDVVLEVADKFRSTRRIVTMDSDKVVLDILSDGTGVSFFEFCEDSGVTIRGQLPRSPYIVKENTNLNNITEPGFYLIPENVLSTISNKPTGAPTEGYVIFEVIGDESLSDQTSGVSQRYRPIVADYDLKIWERDGTGDWFCTYAGKGNLLWSGNEALGNGVQVELSDAITHQPAGICLVFGHSSGSYFYNTFFVPKYLLSGVLSSNHQFLMSGDGLFSTMGSKRVNIHDEYIEGMASNTTSGTAATGITYNNASFTLKYVIGV